jgi:hypothetical protein
MGIKVIRSKGWTGVSLEAKSIGKAYASGPDRGMMITGFAIVHEPAIPSLRLDRNTPSADSLSLTLDRTPHKESPMADLLDMTRTGGGKNMATSDGSAAPPSLLPVATEVEQMLGKPFANLPKDQQAKILGMVCDSMGIPCTMTAPAEAATDEAMGKYQPTGENGKMDGEGSSSTEAFSAREEPKPGLSPATPGALTASATTPTTPAPVTLAVTPDPDAKQTGDIAALLQAVAELKAELKALQDKEAAEKLSRVSDEERVSKALSTIRATEENAVEKATTGLTLEKLAEALQGAGIQLDRSPDMGILRGTLRGETHVLQMDRVSGTKVKVPVTMDTVTGAATRLLMDTANAFAQRQLSTPEATALQQSIGTIPDTVRDQMGGLYHRAPGAGATLQLDMSRTGSAPKEESDEQVRARVKQQLDALHAGDTDSIINNHK